MVIYSPDFLKAVHFTLEREGILSNDATDPGGLTKYGINAKDHPDIDICNLTKDQAIDIYFHDYWFLCYCHTMPYPSALAVFECAVNQGPGTAIRLLQQALGVTVDGQFGARSQAALSASHRSPDMLSTFLALRVQRYVAIKATNPAEYEEDNKGWFRRLFLCCMEGFKCQ